MATSASDKVRLSYKQEATLGVIKSAGNMIEIRKTDESMSGTPKITESAEVVSDAQPTGQLIVGLDVGGGINAELAPTISQHDFIEAGMRSKWGGGIASSGAVIVIDTAAKTLTGTLTTFVTDGFAVGDMVALSNFANAVNNVVVQITAVTETVITYAGASTMVDETGGGDEVVTRPAYLDWGNRFGGEIDSGLQTLTIDNTAKTITRDSGSFVTDGFAIGDQPLLSGFVTSKNNTSIILTNVTALVLTYDAGSVLVDETGTGSEKVVLPANTNFSFTLAKDFLDLTDKSLTYAGERVGSFKLDFKYGSIASVAFTMMGTGYEVPATPFTTGKTISAVATEPALNASSDLGLVIVDGQQTNYCIEGINLDINNNMLPIECMGAIAPKDQQATGLSVNVGMDVFLQDANFDFHAKKLAQTPVAISYYVRDSSGRGYAVQVPAVQLSFSDAAGAGKRQLSKLSLSGVAKKDGTLNRTIRIYKLV